MEIERWHPVTSDLGLIQAPLARVVSELVAWHQELGIRYRRQEITSSLADSLSKLEPLSAEKRRRLFVTTRAGWTACFQSGIAGSDPFPAMSFLAGRMGVMAMRVCCAPTDAKWPAVIWEVYAPPELGGSSPLNVRRSIGASNDGGRWVFEESGTQFPFENTDSYQLPRKRDRFTRTLLEAYLDQFGLVPLSDDFYQVGSDAPAIMLERSDSRWAQSPPEYTLEQVLAGVPWQR